MNIRFIKKAKFLKISFRCGQFHIQFPVLLSQEIRFVLQLGVGVLSKRHGLFDHRHIKIIRYVFTFSLDVAIQYLYFQKKYYWNVCCISFFSILFFFGPVFLILFWKMTQGSSQAHRKCLEDMISSRWVSIRDI